MSLATAVSSAGRLADAPLQPDRAQARGWLLGELSKQEYQQAKPGLVERLIGWFWDRLNGIDLGGGAPIQVGLVVVAVLVALVVAYSVYRAGGLRRTARRRAVAALPDRPSTAAEHRAAADRHAAAGEWGPAVVERFRAIARELEERALLAPQPGRTADEVARDGGRELPALAGDLLVAAGHFDDVVYGQLAPGPAADAQLRQVDEALRRADAVPR